MKTVFMIGLLLASLTLHAANPQDTAIICVSRPDAAGKQYIVNIGHGQQSIQFGAPSWVEPRTVYPVNVQLSSGQLLTAAEGSGQADESGVSLMLREIDIPVGHLRVNLSGTSLKGTLNLMSESNPVPVACVTFAD